MRGRIFRITGLVLVLFGIVLFLNASSSITGFVILENVDAGTSSILGIVLLAVGFLVFIVARKRTGGLEDKSDAGIDLVGTKRFEKAVKGHDIKSINRALSKIGTGGGKEHALTGERKGEYAIRTSGGGRIVYHYNGDHSEVILEDYLPDHKYRKAG